MHFVNAEEAELAPEWNVQQWFNQPCQARLAHYRGKVVVVHAFQMLCPGCVLHGLPQAQRIERTFASSDVAVIGLHTVFEHHAAMGPVALEAFLQEYRVTFPVAIDKPSSDESVPRTMRAYGMRGTPTLIVIDRKGRLRLHVFGRPDDMAVGAAIASLLGEPWQRNARGCSPVEAGAIACLDGCEIDVASLETHGGSSYS